MPGFVAPDGELRDAYVLGPAEPLSRFSGTCIAVVHRLDANEDKLVVVPPGMDLTDEQMRQAAEFQEPFSRRSSSAADREPFASMTRGKVDARLFARYAVRSGGAVLLVARTVLEGRALRAEPAGYEEYADRVRYRLLPGVW